MSHPHRENELSSLVLPSRVDSQGTEAALDDLLADHQTHAYTFLIDVRGAL